MDPHDTDAQAAPPQPSSSEAASFPQVPTADSAPVIPASLATQPPTSPPNSQPFTQTSAQAPAAAVGIDHPEHSPALEVVLQWLTYVFWFWTLCVISVVLSGSLAYFIVSASSGSQWIAYMLAALFILLPVAMATDHYYKKIEPVKKRGFAAVVMVINAVIACIAAVGSFITVAITLTSLLVDGNASDTKTVTIVSSLIVASMSLLFFLRIIYISKLEFVRKKFGLIMCAVTALALLLAIFGPLVGNIKRKTDRLIESNYYSIKHSIEDYTRSHKSLPASLADVEFKDDTAKAIATGRISYKKVQQSTTYTPSSTSSPSTNLKYEICVDWEYENGSGYSYRYNNSYYGGSHKAGQECYQESTYVYAY